MNLEQPNTGISNSDVAWLGRLVTKVETSVDKLGERIEALQRTMAQDMRDMRDGFRAEVDRVENRVTAMEVEIAKLRQIAAAAVAVAGVCLAGLGAIAVPRLWGNAPTPPTVHTPAK